MISGDNPTPNSSGYSQDGFNVERGEYNMEAKHQANKEKEMDLTQIQKYNKWSLGLTLPQKLTHLRPYEQAKTHSLKQCGSL